VLVAIIHECFQSIDADRARSILAAVLSEAARPKKAYRRVAIESLGKIAADFPAISILAQA